MHIFLSKFPVVQTVSYPSRGKYVSLFEDKSTTVINVLIDRAGDDLVQKSAETASNRRCVSVSGMITLGKACHVIKHYECLEYSLVKF